MKRNLLIILSLLLLILCGCGNGAENTASKDSSSQSSSVPSETVSEPLSEPSSESSSETTSFTHTEMSTFITTTVSAAATPEASTESEKPPETSLLPEDYENAIVKTAEGLLGIDFAEGGASPAEGFDNSGFIYYVLRKNGYIGCPRGLDEQAVWGDAVGYDEIKPGDVVFFANDPGGSAAFGGIYAGGGIMIYSPFPGEKVKTADITTNYWKTRFATALSL